MANWSISLNSSCAESLVSDMLMVITSVSEVSSCEASICNLIRSCSWRRVFSNSRATSPYSSLQSILIGSERLRCAISLITSLR
ncbi:Uncharacterised protein [Vibrio cholerae]|nr:Uncharacterised protein [Vibrio cholerae]